MLDKAPCKSKQNESHLKTKDPQEVKTGAMCAPALQLSGQDRLSTETSRLQSEEVEYRVRSRKGCMGWSCAPRTAQHPPERTRRAHGPVFAIEEVTHRFVRNDKLSPEEM